MAKKNRCYLCGGKLLDGRCQDCGLDNMRNYRKHFHLNESDSVESINGDTGQASVECDVKAGQAPGKCRRSGAAACGAHTGQWKQCGAADTKCTCRYNGKFSECRKKSGRPLPEYARTEPHTRMDSSERPEISRTVRSHGRGVKIAVAVIGLIVVLAVFISDYVQEHNRDSGVAYEDGYASEPVTGEDGPYEFVERELSETGDVFETELGQGEYLVGVHLPEEVIPQSFWMEAEISA